jgi:ElaA protein
MLKYCEKNFNAFPIECKAQFYLKAFYESFGFVASGAVYDDVGIPHIKMIKQ